MIRYETDNIQFWLNVTRIFQIY